MSTEVEENLTNDSHEHWLRAEVKRLTSLVDSMTTALQRLMSTCWGAEDGEPPPFANWAEALKECSDALAKVEEKQ